MPCTFGPGEPLLAAERPVADDEDRAEDDQRTGEVEVVLLEEPVAVPSALKMLLSWPQIGQNGQNTGAKNKIVMNAIQASDSQPTIL